jgi:hypothetical protein
MGEMKYGVTKNEYRKHAEMANGGVSAAIAKI